MKRFFPRIFFFFNIIDNNLSWDLYFSFTRCRFLNAIKQYLCLSLLKNSALSAMAIFQLQCSIFMNLLSKFRSGLKKEIGMFFPMLILRVLENVLQPSFLQKMTVLNLLDKISQDPQIIIDIFVNYDCDVDASNIFERYLAFVIFFCSYTLLVVSFQERKWADNSKGLNDN